MLMKSIASSVSRWSRYLNQTHSVLVRLDGGLGNQLFQYAAGRAVALKTGRTLLLDPSPIPRRPHGRSYELHAFAIEERFIHPLELAAFRAAESPRLPAFARRAARWLSPRKWTLLRDPGDGFDPALFTAPGNLVLEGQWQSSEYAREAAPQLRREFTVKSPLPRQLEPVAAAIRDSQSIALHVRRGDYVTDPTVNTVHGVQPADYYNAAARIIAERVASPAFFVLSEDLDWAEANLVLPGKPWFVRESAGLPPHEDHRLMAGCRHFIIANSTYSWWAAWLGADPEKIVIAPRQWFANGPAPPGLIPGEWVAIESGATTDSRSP